MTRRNAGRAALSTALEHARHQVPAVRAALARPFLRHVEMRFPTYRDSVSRSVARSDDPFRMATMALAIQRVLDDGIEGALAEVGVWRGETSAFLHAMAPERPLYLFDTFEGFPSADLPPDADDRRFRDTSVAAVRRRVGDAPSVVITPGRVPETLDVAAAETFAFVLLDLDLYEPTVRSLEFFYPRLSPGAYLVVHDYNNSESEWACKRALDSFLVDRPEQLIEIADTWGTAMFRRAG